MFTGIIQSVAPITQLESAGAGQSLRFAVASGFTDLEPGESIAVNGVCLTVTEYDAAGEAWFFVSPESLAKTNLGQLQRGSRCNLERAVTLATRLSGHLVQGHVDGLGRLVAIEAKAESYFVRFAIPTRLARYCVEKGSIALNGVSLTINSLTSSDPIESLISIVLIPHTWAHTQFSDAKVGAPINVEVDVLAKYVETLGRPYAGASRHPAQDGSVL